MMGISEKPRATTDDKIIPIEKFGLKVMSIGFLVNEEDAVIWRGPMVHGAIKQFIEDVEWSGTDYLIIDLPPGTGDAQLSLGTDSSNKWRGYSNHSAGRGPRGREKGNTDV